MKSIMTHNFSEAPKADIQRSSFDRSHGYKTTFDAGNLIPFLADEALPGDTFTVKTTAFARLATPIFPIMDNMRMDTFYFAVPYRLIWDNWEHFNGAQDDPGDSIDFLVPTMDAPASTGHLNQSLSDYLGIPTEIADLTHNSLHHRAYNLIWNEWFRDENLQNRRTVNRNDGPDNTADYEIKRRGKRHDYFTSCLPWPQKGVSVDFLAGTAPIVTNDEIIKVHSVNDATDRDLTLLATTDGGLYASSYAGTQSKMKWGAETGMEANLSASTNATINELREAFQVQKLLERDARGGTRYIEIIRSHFGVTSPDARLQRPEYLGGGSAPVTINPIQQTSSTDGTSPQGNLAAQGTATFENGFTKSFTEHCIIIGLVSVRADLTYQQGLNRMYSRQTRYDFYWPAFAHLSEQSVLNKEIYAQNDANDDLVFGYQERFAEYRYFPSMITGRFRSNYAQSLDAWHLSQEFTSLPLLNNTFIQDTPPIDRIVAVTTEPDFLFDSYIDMRCARPMPLYSIPGLVDHF